MEREGREREREGGGISVQGWGDLVSACGTRLMA